MQGNDEIRDLNMRANAMRIIQVDSLDEEDSALAKERDDAAKYNEPKKPKPDTSIQQIESAKKKLEKIMPFSEGVRWYSWVMNGMAMDSAARST